MYSRILFYTRNIFYINTQKLIFIIGILVQIINSKNWHYSKKSTVDIIPENYYTIKKI